MEIEIDDDIRAQFSYQNDIPDAGRTNFHKISEALMSAAQVIRNCTPQSADQTIALQHLVDARMRSNKAIAHGGESFQRR